MPAASLFSLLMKHSYPTPDFIRKVSDICRQERRDKQTAFVWLQNPVDRLVLASIYQQFFLSDFSAIHFDKNNQSPYL